MCSVEGCKYVLVRRLILSSPVEELKTFCESTRSEISLLHSLVDIISLSLNSFLVGWFIAFIPSIDMFQK